MPIGVSDRDLVQNVSRRYDEATNTTYIMFHGCTHPSKPEMHGIVRYNQLQVACAANS